VTWTQGYDPLGRWWLSTIVAALPILVLLGLLAGFRLRAHPLCGGRSSDSGFLRDRRLWNASQASAGKVSSMVPASDCSRSCGS
jgi:hypothetical protein